MLVSLDLPLLMVQIALVRVAQKTPVPSIPSWSSVEAAFVTVAAEQHAAAVGVEVLDLTLRT